MAQVILNDVLRPNYKVPFPDPVPISEGVSFLGTDILDAVTFAAPTLEGFDESLFTLKECIMSVQESKNIVETPIAGRDGEIFEYISMASHVITLRGKIVGPYQDIRPDEEIGLLMQWLRYPDTIEIFSRYLQNHFGITRVIVKDYNLPQTEAYRNEQQYRITLKEDLGEDIIIEENAV